MQNFPRKTMGYMKFDFGFDKGAYKGVEDPRENSNCSDVDEIYTICIRYYMMNIPKISASLNYCKPPKIGG